MKNSSTQTSFGGNAVLAAMRELHEGFSRWSKLKDFSKSTGGEVFIATDNDIALMFANPKASNAQHLDALFVETNEFSRHEQAVSLCERMASFIFQMDVENSREIEKRWTLPGHTDELYHLLDAAFFASLRDSDGVLPDEISREIQSFREYLRRTVAGNPPSIAELLQVMSSQMKSWLGFGSDELKWDRLAALHRQQAFNSIARSVDVSKNYFEKSDFIGATKFWRGRLGRGRPTLDKDAYALAALELFNIEIFLPRGDVLILISGADHVWNAAGAEMNSRVWSTEKVRCPLILRPWDILDECDIKLAARASQSGSLDMFDVGRLKASLQIVFTVNREPHEVSVATAEFAESWNLFLQICVAHRVRDQLKWQNRSPLRRVKYVLEQASRLSGADLVQTILIERGQQVMIRAADLGLLSIQPEAFLRSAPILYFSRDLDAQNIQKLSPSEYISQIADPESLPALESQSWYIRQLLAARAFGWSGKWDICRRLARYALNAHNSLKASSNEEVNDITGREAYMLLAIAERHISGGSLLGLDAARRYLQDYENIVEKDLKLSSVAKRICKLRADCEKGSLRLTSSLSAYFEQDGQAQARGALLDLELAESMQNLADEAKQLVTTLEPASQSIEITILYMLAHRCSINAVQVHLYLRTSLNILSAAANAAADAAANLKINAPSLPESRFAQIVRGVAESRIAGKRLSTELRRTLAEMRDGAHIVFSYDQARAVNLLELVAAAEVDSTSDIPSARP